MGKYKRPKLINADQFFVAELRDMQRKMEEKFQVKLTDQESTRIITPYLKDIFNLNHEDITIDQKGRRRNPLRFL